MNRLAPGPGGDRTWLLPGHAHVVVHGTDDGREFVTVYDCGAAQKPPSAQLIGDSVRVEADHELVSQPTGYIAKLREPSVLERRGERRWLVRPDGSNDWR
jgi:hypothetical protein